MKTKHTLIPALLILLSVGLVQCSKDKKDGEPGSHSCGSIQNDEMLIGGKAHIRAYDLPGATLPGNSECYAYQAPNGNDFFAHSTLMGRIAGGDTSLYSTYIILGDIPDANATLTYTLTDSVSMEQPAASTAGKVLIHIMSLMINEESELEVADTWRSSAQSGSVTIKTDVDGKPTYNFSEIRLYRNDGQELVLCGKNIICRNQ